MKLKRTAEVSVRFSKEDATPGCQSRFESHRYGLRRRRALSTAGFTLIEMLIVISIILILVSIVVPQYSQSVRRARESVLKQDLYDMRKLISEYTLDKQKAPQSLEDLVQAGYLKPIPKDPISGEPNWQVEQCDDSTIMSPDEQDQGGICDVHSSSTAVGTDGTAYNTW